jgi:hypothetical protein
LFEAAGVQSLAEQQSVPDERVCVVGSQHNPPIAAVWLSIPTNSALLFNPSARRRARFPGGLGGRGCRWACCFRARQRHPNRRVGSRTRAFDNIVGLKPTRGLVIARRDSLSIGVIVPT